MPIDKNDLVLLDTFKVGEVFYRAEPGGTFSMCCLQPEEVEDKTSIRYLQLRHATAQYMKEGRLFTNRNNPGKPLMK